MMFERVFVVVVTILVGMKLTNANPHEICSKPLDPGSYCSAPPHIKWGYDWNQHKCVQFEFKGCGGNNNWYNDETHCKQLCLWALHPHLAPQNVPQPAPVPVPAPNPVTPAPVTASGSGGSCKYSKGVCNSGYVDQTNGNYKYWSCGSGCAGGAYYTTAGCSCACIPLSQCTTKAPTPAPVTCYAQRTCNSGYMDKTNGNYKFWSCGSGCPGGAYKTDGGCSCACIPKGTCAVFGITPLWQKYLEEAKYSSVGYVGLSGGLLIFVGVGVVLYRKNNENSEYESLLESQEV